MAVITPPTIVAAPTPPDRGDRATFSVRATASFEHLKNHAIPEIQAVAENVALNAADAATSATSAAAQVGLAADQVILATAQAGIASGLREVCEGFANAEMWVSGTTYALGDLRWSPANLKTYRRIVAGAGATDPSLDATNWGPATVSLLSNYQEFLTSGTWVKPEGATWVYTELVGGGASGAYTGGSSYGGGGGAFMCCFLRASALSGSVTVTIGAGGASCAGYVNNPGGDSTFGSYVTAKGAPGKNAGGGELSGNAVSVSIGSGGYSSGGGGYGQSAGGRCVQGGAGGGGGDSSGGTGGVSQNGGNGGSGGGSTATEGSVPGGGGGGGYSGNGAAGGSGRVRVWCW